MKAIRKLWQRLTGRSDDVHLIRVHGCIFVGVDTDLVLTMHEDGYYEMTGFAVMPIQLYREICAATDGRVQCRDLGPAKSVSYRL